MDEEENLEYSKFENEAPVTSTPQTSVVDFDLPPPSAESQPAEEKPIGPMLNTDKIISETEDICASNLKIYMKQKLFFTSLAYLMRSMQQLLANEYQPYLERLNTFLVNCTENARNYHLDNVKWILPCYKEYLSVLSNHSEKIWVEGIPNSVVEADLLQIAETAYTNLYAGAVEVTSLNEVNKSINYRMDIRWEHAKDQRCNWILWYETIRNQLELMEKRSQYNSSVLVDIGFLKIDQSLPQIP